MLLLFVCFFCCWFFWHGDDMFKHKHLVLQRHSDTYVCADGTVGVCVLCIIIVLYYIYVFSSNPKWPKSVFFIMKLARNNFGLELTFIFIIFDRVCVLHFLPRKWWRVRGGIKLVFFVRYANIHVVVTHVTVVTSGVFSRFVG